jgi:hypothetical protein
MRAFCSFLSATILLCFFFTGCKQEVEEFKTDLLSDYIPLQVGKYITYRIDSTVFTEAGRGQEIRSYLEKDVVDAQVTDNEGRPSYRIYRFLNTNLSGSGTWFANGSYLITPLEHSIEVIENNMRSVKLIAPVQKGTTWKGNRFIIDDPFAGIYSFSLFSNQYTNRWEFEIKGTDESLVFNNKTIDHVVTVQQIDERFSLDTVSVVANRANLPTSKNGVWLIGSATDTIILTAAPPQLPGERLTIYNQTNSNASLNNIIIPPGLSFSFEFYNNSWNYTGILTVQNNKVTLPFNASLAYIFGSATNGADSIKVDGSKIDTTETRTLTIYNKSNKNAYVINLSSPLNTIAIPPGFGRTYELDNKVWRLYNNRDVLLDKDPYSNLSPVGNSTYGVEKYAKGIGLVYQELIMWDLQPNPGGTPYKIGFAIKRSMVSHN